MRWVEGVHGPYQAHVIDHRRELRNQLTDLDAALAMFLEFERRREEAARRSLRTDVHGARPLTRVFRQARLGIEHVQLRWTSRHEQADDVLRPSRQRAALIQPRSGGARLID